MKNEMKEVLKKYLGQYERKKRRKRILEQRLKNFRIEMLGTKGINYSPVPKSRTNNITDEPAEFCVKQEEIEKRIEKERKQASSAMLKVMDILEFLPEDSDEKNVLEMKYIDGMSWEKIATAQSMSKSRCIDYWNIGLNTLLGYKKVQRIMEDYRNVFKTNKNV